MTAAFVNEGLPLIGRLEKLDAITIQQMRVQTKDHRPLKLEKISMLIAFLLGKLYS